jgi:hypothetical protein
MEWERAKDVLSKNVVQCLNTCETIGERILEPQERKMDVD